MAVAAAVAGLALRGWLRRLLGAIALGGLWFVAEPLFAAAVGLIVLGAFFWLLGRLLSGKKLMLAVAALVLAGGFALLLGVVAVALRPAVEAKRHYEPPMPASVPAPEEAREQGVPAGAGAGKDDAQAAAKSKGELMSRRGNFMAQDAAGGVLEGVTPVALTLPQYERSVYATRELVTRERPFRPVLLYATAWAAWPLGIAWLACIAALIQLYRPTLLALSARMRERLARGSTAAAIEPPPAPPP
jgi:hypothetical protein